MKLFKILLVLGAFQATHAMEINLSNVRLNLSNCMQNVRALFGLQVQDTPKQVQDIPKFKAHPNFYTVKSLVAMSLLQVALDTSEDDLKKAIEQNHLPDDVLFNEDILLLKQAMRELEIDRTLSNETLAKVVKKLVIVDALLSMHSLQQGNDCLLSTFLYKAAETGNIKLLDYLLNRKANIHIVDSQGNTLSHYAARGCQEECMGYLYGCGIDAMRVNSDGIMPKEILSAAQWRELAQFSSDGTRVVTESCDGTLKIWNTVTGELIRVLSPLNDN